MSLLLYSKERLRRPVVTVSDKHVCFQNKTNDFGGALSVYCNEKLNDHNVRVPLI